MCCFLSALVKKNGDILAKPEVTDSHEDLIEHFGLKDNDQHLKYFVRVEFHPGDAALHELDKYTLYLDERETPDWFEDVKEKAERKLRACVKKMIISNEKPILLGGCYILHGDAKIRKVQGSRIISMRDNASVKNVGGNASVTDVGDNASVKNVGGNASVTDVGDNASVTDVWGNASVTDVRGNASVTDVWGNASVTDVWGNASVTDVRGNAKIINDRREKK